VISPAVSDLRVTLTTTPSVGTGIHGLYRPGVVVSTLIVSPSTTTFTVVSSTSVKSADENSRDFNTTSSSPDLFGLILNSANVLLDLRRTVFLAEESTLRDPCLTTLTFTVSSSASQAVLLSSSSHTNAMLNVSAFPIAVALGVISNSTLTVTDFPSATSISSISHFAQVTVKAPALSLQLFTFITAS
jgi:hypothetical protein